jgi:hypothetical protein
MSRGRQESARATRLTTVYLPRRSVGQGCARFGLSSPELSPRGDNARTSEKACDGGRAVGRDADADCGDRSECIGDASTNQDRAHLFPDRFSSE